MAVLQSTYLMNAHSRFIPFERDRIPTCRRFFLRLLRLGTINRHLRLPLGPQFLSFQTLSLLFGIQDNLQTLCASVDVFCIIGIFERAWFVQIGKCLSKADSLRCCASSRCVATDAGC